MKNTYFIKIPNYVSKWTDKYFHQSAFDIPLELPNKKVIIFLSQFKRKQKIKLFRGMNKFNKEISDIVSWTYDKKIAENYIKNDGGKIIEKNFYSDDILLDTTVLDSEQKKLLGYDYKIDDKEVLIISKKLL